MPCFNSDLKSDIMSFLFGNNLTATVFKTGLMSLSLFTIPQITAMLFTRDFARVMPLAAFWGALGSVMGLFASYALNIPSGATIICFLTLQFLVVKGVVIIIGRNRLN